MSKKVHVIISLSIILLCILRSNLIGISKSPKILATTIGFPTNIPAIYVEPAFISASPGETFNVSVRIFNLTNSFWQTETQWFRGDDLGPWSDFALYNYSLGNLNGIDIQLGWDETVLKFVSNVTKIPVETHPDGILHQPIFKIKDEVNETHGFPWPQPEESRYWLAYATFGGQSFNGNGTVLELTFEVLKEGASNLTLTRTQLSAQVPLIQSPQIPHKFISALFRSPGARTRLGEIDVGAFVGGEHLKPALGGEDVNISVQVRNDGNVTDSYNLTLSYDNEPLQNAVWTAQTLDPGNSSIFTYILNASDLSRGVHNISSYLSVLHDGGLFNDTSLQQFRVVVPPQLVISGPSSAGGGETVVFNASDSIHLDPDGYILSYTWGLWAPGETMAQFTYEGVTFAHQFSSLAKNGTWRIVLSVMDNFGVTYSESRPFSLPYKTEAALVIHTPYSVHNLDTGLNYTTIQEAIDAPETLDGHEIFVEEGTYWEHVEINKSLSIMGENRNTTIVDGNGAGTVVIIAADNVSLTGFTIQGSNLFSQTSGIYASQWTIGSNISHNIITDNWNGIEFDYYCSNNTVSDNIVVSNEYDGIKFEYFAFNNTVRRNTVSMNNEDGIMFWTGGGNNIIEDNVVHSNRYDGINHQKGNNVIVKGNWLHNNSLGIFIDGCYNSLISHNNVTDNSGFSLLLSGGINNIVENNRVLNGYDGIFISWECFNNTIINNTIMHITRWGIAIDWYCSNNTIEKNTISDCSIGIYLYQTNNNTVLHNNVSKNGRGISIYGAGNSTVIGNTISSNDRGVYLIATSNNLLIQNNIVNNDLVGLKLITSSNNLLIQNNIVNNTCQVSGSDLVSRWDDGLEGNFWSNYSGVDINHDGIGDSPYLLEYGNQDNYPLMGAFHSFNVSQDNNVNVISNSTIMDLEYFESNGSIRMHISNMTVNQTHGFVRICIPHTIMTEPYNITVNGANPTYWNYTLYDNGTHRWIYFAYEHTELEVIIIPEFPSLTILPLFMITALLAGIIYRRKMVKSTSPGELLR